MAASWLCTLLQFVPGPVVLCSHSQTNDSKLLRHVAPSPQSGRDWFVHHSQTGMSGLAVLRSQLLCVRGVRVMEDTPRGSKLVRLNILAARRRVGHWDAYGARERHRGEAPGRAARHGP